MSGLKLYLGIGWATEKGKIKPKKFLFWAIPFANFQQCPKFLYVASFVNQLDGTP